MARRTFRMGRRCRDVKQRANQFAKHVALTAALLLAVAPAVAQVAAPGATNQTGVGTTSGTTSGSQSLGTLSQGTSSPSPTTGVICIEEMTATFCNVATGGNSAGYGSTGVSGGSGGSSSGGSGSSSTGVGITPSTPPCGDFPPANELCD